MMSPEKFCKGTSLVKKTTVARTNPTERINILIGVKRSETFKNFN